MGNLYQKEPNAIWFCDTLLKCSVCSKKVKTILEICPQVDSKPILVCYSCLPKVLDNLFCFNEDVEFLFMRNIVFAENCLTTNRKREPIGLSLRFKVMQRDKFRCKLCGNDSTSSKLEIDHIIPVSLGGKNTLDNLQTLCFNCNRGKRDDLMEKNND